MKDYYKEGLEDITSLYCRIYSDNPTLFLRMFFKFKSVRTSCYAISKTLKIDCEKDFNEYCNKFKLNEHDHFALNGVLKIIYEVIKK